jgi:hypothetical protein
MTNKLYRGVRRNNLAVVYVDDVELSFDEARRLHPSEATPEFGYFGDGPSQTALAILYDAIQSYPNADFLALKYYHDFKNAFIAPADYELGFTILESQVTQWLNTQLSQEENLGGWAV